MPPTLEISPKSTTPQIPNSTTRNLLTGRFRLPTNPHSSPGILRMRLQFSIINLCPIHPWMGPFREPVPAFWTLAVRTVAPESVNLPLRTRPIQCLLSNNIFPKPKTLNIFYRWVRWIRSHATTPTETLISSVFNPPTNP